jgi:glutamate synthase (NADPH/NADH) small chain
MGKVTGFMEYHRQEEQYLEADHRVKNHHEFVINFDDQAMQQQSARCMDCGTPFCNNGCPVNNIIPDFNDLVYQKDWKNAFDTLSSTNNFPEFTGRICPAPCESACVLNINNNPVTIKSIERGIIDRAWKNGWVQPQIAKQKTGKTVAIIGSGPAGLAAAQQLARVGHSVTVYEKNDRIGGLLRYGIPDFKMEKNHIDRRVLQMEAEGVVFKMGVLVGDLADNPANVTNWSNTRISPQELINTFDAVLLAGGAEHSRDLPVEGRNLQGIHFAMEFLPQQNKVNAGDTIPTQINAQGKNVVVIGGGDTGSDCVGTSYRHGAKTVTQFELMPEPPEEENKSITWPYWPLKLRTSSSHLEGNTIREFAIATKAFVGKEGKVTGVKTIRITINNDGRFQEVPGTEVTIPADLVLLAMGFVSPVAGVLDTFGIEKDQQGNAKAHTEEGGYFTNIPKIFAAGDMRKGQSLVVWAIREGRQAARSIDQYLMGYSILPR